MKKSLYLLVALAMIATMLLAACAAPAAQPAPQPAAPTEAPKAAAEPTAAPAPAEGKVPTIAFSGFAMTNEFWNALEKAAEAEAARPEGQLHQPDHRCARRRGAEARRG